MRLVLEWHPQGAYGGRSVLVYGQALGAAGSPAEARDLFTGFLRKFPSSALAPDLGLAVARTWQQEGRWAEASAEYGRWIGAHDADHPARGQAVYEWAWSAHRAGDEEGAFERFSQFLRDFALHPLAPSALFWVADMHFRQGRYDVAESEYQRVYQNTNWPGSALKLQARMMAGRSAFRRAGYRDARAYFTELINLAPTNAPPELLPEAYFALGDAIRQGAEADKAVTGLAEAIVAYSKIPQQHPQSSLVPLAWGEIGNCHFQLAKADPKQHDLAIAAFTQVVGSAAPVAARSQAEVGVAMCLEAKAALPGVTNRTALQIEALERYLRVVEGGNLKPGEEAEMFWVERAGATGALLAEQLQRWEVAERLYTRLMDLVPLLRVKYEVRRDRVRQARASADAAG
jgi:TolA-binding protein